MNDRSSSPDEANGEDLGPPVTELRELVEESSPLFLHRLRGRIERRTMMSQMLDLSLPMVGRVLMEYISMFFALFERDSVDPKREDDQDG